MCKIEGFLANKKIEILELLLNVGTLRLTKKMPNYKQLSI